MTPELLNNLWKMAVAKFQLPENSLHGPVHWKRVEKNFMEIVSESSDHHQYDSDDLDTGRLFAMFHDCCRLDEWEDKEHGVRAVEFLQSIARDNFRIPDGLLYAIKFHNDGQTCSDPIIGACWDADRLDLTRVGIVPDVDFFSTNYGRRKAQEIRSSPLRMRWL